MPHSFQADDVEPQPQTASGRSGKGRGGSRGPHTATGMLDMPDPPKRSRMGTLMDRLREVTGRKKRREKP
jgi:hypothetical protein